MRILLLMFGAACSIAAHTGEPLARHDLWTAWSAEPGVILPLLITAFLYGRGARLKRGVRRWEMACFWTGWSALALALASPLHPLGESLFSAHMAQHEILMAVAAPLLVLSRPAVALLWGIPLAWRKVFGECGKRPTVRGAWLFISAPLMAWLLHAVVLWGWHVPALFQLTLKSDFIHALQHASFFGVALLYWWSLLHAHGRKGYGTSMLSLFTTAIHSVLLGAILTMAPQILYPAYSPRTLAWGLTPLEDQQLAGLIMWVPAGFVYVGAGLAVCAAWLRESEGRVRELERAPVWNSVRRED